MESYNLARPTKEPILVGFYSYICIYFFGEVHKFRLSGGGGYMYLLHKINGKVLIWRSGLVSQC